MSSSEEDEELSIMSPVDDLPEKPREIVAVEEKEGDESATGEENETLPHDEAEDRRVKMEVKTFKELKAVLKPRCSPLWRNKKAHFFNLKWYSIHVVRTVGISALLVLLMFGFTSLPYSNPVEPGQHEYFRPYPVAFGFAAFTTFVYMVISYGFFVLLYGFNKTKALLFVAIPALAWAVGNWFVFLVLGYEPWWYGLDLVSYGVFALLVISSCLILNRTFSHHKRNFLVIFALPILVHMIIIGLYAYVILPFYRAIPNTPNGQFLRFIFRVVIHPIVNVLNLVTTQAFVHQFESVDPPFLATGYALGIQVEGSFIGRLMLITIGTNYDAILPAIGIGLAQILLRSSHARIFKTVQFLRRRYCTCACVIEDDIIDWETEKVMRAAYMHYYMSVENSSVFVITAMFAMFWKHRQVWNLAYTDYANTEPPYATLIYSGIIQLAINFSVDYISVLMERAQKIYTFRPFRREPVRMAIWEIVNMMQMMLLIIYINRMLPFVGFCGQEPSQKLDPCQCRIGIDFGLFNTTCNGTFVDSAIRYILG